MHRIFVQILAVTVMLSGVWSSGCHLMTDDLRTPVTAVETPGTAPVSAGRVPEAQTAIELEVFFVDRHPDDPLIGKALWSELHQLSALDPARRDQLAEHGFRFGIAASRPPRSVQALMSLSTPRDPVRRASKQQYVLPSGQETWLMATQLPPTCTIRLPDDEAGRELEVGNGRCVFRVRAEEVEDGWARLEILPEVWANDLSLHPRPNDHDWVYDRKKTPLYEDRFHVELNVGEIVVIGRSTDADSPFGDHFFRTVSDDVDVERLLMIRLSRMREVQPVRVPRSEL